MKNIVTVHNIREMEYTALVELLHDIYTKEIPAVDDPESVITELEKLAVFFSNQYAYMVELWAVMVHQVRYLKRTSKNKDAIDDAMDKRDMMEKVMSATRLKYFASSGLMRHKSEER